MFEQAKRLAIAEHAITVARGRLCQDSDKFEDGSWVFGVVDLDAYEAELVKRAAAYSNALAERSAALQAFRDASRDAHSFALPTEQIH